MTADHQLLVGRNDVAANPRPRPDDPGILGDPPIAPPLMRDEELARLYAGRRYDDAPAPVDRRREDGPMAGSCLWCGRQFEPRKDGGKRQRFCCSDHRRAFHRAAARWMADAIETGLVSRAVLREGLSGNAALLPDSLGAPRPEVGAGEAEGCRRASAASAAPEISGEERVA